jgi:hypothetical protein
VEIVLVVGIAINSLQEVLLDMDMDINMEDTITTTRSIMDSTNSSSSIHHLKRKS